jgi:hypothetical protein
MIREGDQLPDLAEVTCLCWIQKRGAHVTQDIFLFLESARKYQVNSVAQFFRIS